jgi:hypothetical protein
VTVISRQESSATFPSGVTVEKGDYASSEFLESTLDGQDVLIITLATTASPEVKTSFIKATAKAGIPWVFPNTYSIDGASPELCKANFFLLLLAKVHAQIEKLGKSSWIAIANNP